MSKPYLVTYWYFDDLSCLGGGGWEDGEKKFNSFSDAVSYADELAKDELNHHIKILEVIKDYDNPS